MPRHYSINYFYGGAVMLFLGLLSLTRQSSEETTENHAGMGLIFMALGAFLIYIVIQSNWRIIKAFSLLFLLLSAIQLYYSTEITIWLHNRPHQNHIMEQMFENAWQHRKSMDTQKLIDDIQQKFWCCGFNGTFDYPQDNLPLSCCQNLNCDFPANIFSTGCYDVFQATLPVFLRNYGSIYKN